MNDDLPFNPKNILPTSEDIRNITHFKPQKLDHYIEAFTHRSYCTRKSENKESGNRQCPNNCVELQDCSQERIEYLGDAIIRAALAVYLYERYPQSSEDFLTCMRSKIESGQVLAYLAKQNGLQFFVLLSYQIEINNGRNSSKILEDTFEAFVGAMYLDQGFDIAKDWVLDCVESSIDFAQMVLKEVNSKDTFLKRYQQRYKKRPTFRTKDSNNPTIVIEDTYKTISIGKGETIRDAERHASRKAMDFLCLDQPVDS